MTSGKRTELAGTAFAAFRNQFVAAGPERLRSPKEALVPGPVTEPAIGETLDAYVAYWLDGAQAPQMRVLGGWAVPILS